MKSEAFPKGTWSGENARQEAQEERDEETGLEEVKKRASHPAIHDPGEMAKRLISEHELPSVARDPVHPTRRVIGLWPAVCGLWSVVRCLLSVVCGSLCESEAASM